MHTRATQSRSRILGPNSTPNSAERIAYLDGLRGVAILAVLIWHLYGPSYADHLPFGDRYAILPIRVFWVGVELFFLISGFVILMTLERCRSATEFALRRWLRLFPAMLVASLAIFAFDSAFQLGPYASRKVQDLIPGLLFISPSLLHSLFGISVSSMDGPFWSLYVEAMFYFIFGIAYFSFGPRTAIAVLIVVFASACLLEIAAAEWASTGLIQRLASAADWLGLIHFGWFASGALFYLGLKTQKNSLFGIAILVGCAAAFSGHFLSLGLAEHVALLLCVLLFACSLKLRLLQQALQLDILVFTGFVSYPLYLMHNNIAVGLTTWLGQRLPADWQVLAPIFPLSVVVLFSYLVARYCEPPLRRILQLPVQRFFQKRPMDKIELHAGEQLK